MDLTASLLIYLGIVVFSILIFIKLDIRPISSIVLSLLIGQIILVILTPPTAIDPWKDTDSTSAIYYLIQIITPIILLVYVVVTAWNDRRIYFKKRISKIER